MELSDVLNFFYYSSTHFVLVHTFFLKCPVKKKKINFFLDNITFNKTLSKK